MKKLAPKEWRDATINWVLDRINIDHKEVERFHFAKNRNMVRDWTLLIFPSTDARENFKKYLIFANRAGGMGIPIWNTQTQKAVENTKMIWEYYKSDWDKMASIPLKVAFEALRADDCFWTGSACMLRENANEFKINERTNGAIVVQIVIDDSATPPVHEIFVHFGAEAILQRNWNAAWKQLWHKDRTPSNARTTADKIRAKETRANEEFEKYKEQEPPPYHPTDQSQEMGGNLGQA